MALGEYGRSSHLIRPGLQDPTRSPFSCRRDRAPLRMDPPTQALSIFTAIEEQLGLRLESQKVTGEILVIGPCGKTNTKLDPPVAGISDCQPGAQCGVIWSSCLKGAEYVSNSFCT